MDETEYKKDLLSQIKNAYGKVVYSYTTHWKQQNLYSSHAHRIKVIEIVLNSVSTTGLLGFLIFDQWWSALVGTIFSALSLGLSLYTKEMNYEHLIASHRVSADDLWLLREKYISLMTDIPTLSSKEIALKRNELEKESALIYKKASPTTSEAYEMAQKALKEEEEQFFSNEELDLMLPPHLRA